LSDDSIILYGDSRSGNCYKLKLLCAEMGIGYHWHEVDILAGETHTPEFLAMNPNGKIPLLALPDGRHLAESNAILCYLADGSEFLFGTAYERALVLQWLFFEQYSHEPYIATSRFIIRFLGSPPDRRKDLEIKREGGLKALRIMDDQLAQQDYLVNQRYSIADIALYAYTHVAEEGGFGLDDYPAIRAWIERIEQRPNYVPMVTA
jgi:glutathione S-transferase